MVKLLSELQLKKGDEIQIIRGIIKNGRFGERELHLNDNSSIKRIKNQLENSGAFVWQDVLFPGSLSQEHTQSREIDLQGIITSVFKVEEEKRPSFITLVDPESTQFVNHIKVNFWKDRKVELLSVDIGNTVLLEGVNLKENYQNQLEVNFNRNSNLTILSQGNNKLKQLIRESPIISSQSFSGKIVDRNLGTIKIKETFNVVAKIFSIGRIITFNKKDGIEGKVLRIGVFDSYGSTFLVLWDTKVELANDLSINDIIYISGGYLRENKGNYEINLSNQGSLSKRTENVKFNIPETIPDLPINKLTKQWTSISLYGEITTINDTKTFNRNDGSTGKVKTIQIADNTGEIKIVAWNETIEKLETVKLGDVLFIENLSLRLNKFGEFEGHLNKFSTTKVNDLETLPSRVSNISYKLPTYHEMEGNEYRRIRLDELTDDLKTDITNNDNDSNNQIEFRASIINIAESPLYYKACPTCFKKVDPLSGNTGMCPNDNEVEFVQKLLFRVVLDDGSKTFYATMIGNIAERVTGFKPYHVKKLLDYKSDNETKLYQAIKSRIIGNEYFVKGKISTRTVETENSEKIYWDLKINYIALANSRLEMKILEKELIKK